MSKLFASMENEELTVPSEQDTAKAKLEILEDTTAINDASTKITEELDIIDDAVLAAESLEAIRHSLSVSMENNSNVSELAIKLANISTEHICSRLGYAQSKELQISIEDASVSPQETVKVALEGLGNFLSNLWKSIKNFFVRIWESIKGLWNRLFNSTKKNDEAMAKLEKQVIESANKTVSSGHNGNNTSMFLEMSKQIDEKRELIGKAIAKVEAERREDMKSVEHVKKLAFKLQNSFRMKGSDIISKNIIAITKNHIELDKLEQDAFDVWMDIELEEDVVKLAKSVEEYIGSAVKSFGRIVDKTYINGMMFPIVNSDGTIEDRSPLPATKDLDEKNLLLADFDQLKDVIELNKELSTSFKNRFESRDAMQKSIDESVAVMDQIVKNTKNTDNPDLAEGIKKAAASFKTQNAIMVLLYQKIPTFTNFCLDSTREYIDMQLDMKAIASEE